MDLRKLRLYHLYKQNLIDKAGTDQYQDILKRHIALHSTDFLTPYLSLRARVSNFEPQSLFESMNSSRAALKIRAFRGTLFVIHRDHLEDILSAAEIFQSTNWLAIEKYFSKNDIQIESIINSVENILKDKQTLSSKEIKHEVSEKFDIPAELFPYIIRYLEFKCIVVRTSVRYPSDRVIRHGLMKSHFTEIGKSHVDPDIALKRILIKYIIQFGPVSLNDIAWWFPLKKSDVRRYVGEMKRSLTTLTVNDMEYFMEQNDYQQLKSFNYHQINDPVINFLPYEDHFPKAFTARDWYISEEMVPKLIHVRKIEYGQLRPSIWVDGEIVGRWELEYVDKSKSEMTVNIIELNEKIHKNKRISRLIFKEKEELSRFVNNSLLPLMMKKE